MTREEAGFRIGTRTGHSKRGDPAVTMIRAAQWSAFERALRRLYVFCDPIEFPIRLLEAVEPLIGSEITCYTEVLPAEQRVRNVANIHHGELDALLPVLAEFQLQHPQIADYVENGQQGVRTTSDYLSRREWHKRALQRHFYGAMGLEEQLAIMMPAADGAHLGLVFNRKERSFTQSDRALLDLLRPHIAQAYGNAQRVAAARDATCDLDSTLDEPRHGVVRLRADATVWLATRTASDAIDRVRPSRCVGRWVLPPDVSAWIRREIARAERGDIHAPVREMQLIGQGNRVGLRLLEEPASGTWTLLVEDRTPMGGELALPHLAPRLRRVLEHVLMGESEKEIARALDLSRHTVHEYVKQLYRHIGVASRAELMARFVRHGSPRG